MKTVTQEQLKEDLLYDCDTGLFTRRVNANHRFVAGQVAGCMHHTGYILVGIKKQSYLAHRLAWLYVYGEIPTSQIDHINRIKTDNRISNLRTCDNSNNQANIEPKRDGFKGVTKHKCGKFQVQIKCLGVNKYVGLFDDELSASKAYDKAAFNLFGDFANLNHRGEAA